MVTTMMIALGTIIGMSTIAAAPTAHAADMPACWYSPTKEVQKNIQQQLAKLGLYTGNIDGKWGTLSIKAIQQAVYNWGGYTGPIDGAPGQNTCTNVQKFAGTRGDYPGVQDGKLGENTWKGFLTAIKTPPVSVTSVKINSPGTLVMRGGVSITLTATVSPSAAWQKAVTWSTSNAAAATVTNGVITARGTGFAVITVTTKDGKHTNSIPVSVSAGFQARVLDQATRTLGQGWQPFGHRSFFGLGPVQPWCVSYVKEILRRAGFPYTIPTESSSELASFAIKGQYHLKWVAKGPQTTPQPGDIIVWDWDKNWETSPPLSTIFDLTKKPEVRTADHVSIVNVVTSYNQFSFIGGNQGSKDDSKGLVTAENVPDTADHTYGHILGFIRPIA